MSAKPTVTWAENVAEAQRLRASGLTVKQVAHQMGVAWKTVYAWLGDPDGSKRAARQRRYAGICMDCGQPTNGSNGLGQQSMRCAKCLSVTSEDVLDALRRFAQEHGRPPRGCDRTGVAAGSAVRRFGSWNAALRAAGLPTATMDKANGASAARRALVARLYDEGASLTEIAARCGYTNIASVRRSLGERYQRSPRSREPGESRQSPQSRWTREAIVAAMQRWAADHGSLPTSRAWDTPGDHPSSATVKRRFGSWSAGIAAAMTAEPTQNVDGVLGGLKEDFTEPTTPGDAND